MPGATGEDRARLLALVDQEHRGVQEENAAMVRDHATLLDINNTQRDRSFREQILRADARTRLFLNDLLATVNAAKKQKSFKDKGAVQMALEPHDLEELFGLKIDDDAEDLEDDIYAPDGTRFGDNAQKILKLLRKGLKQYLRQQKRILEISNSMPDRDIHSDTSVSDSDDEPPLV